MANNLDNLLDEVENLLPEGNSLPPVEKWHPPLTGDIDIWIARDGKWFHEGDEILRQPLIKLFSSILKREEGQYFLVTPVEKWRIQVEDVPFVVSRLERLLVEGKQLLVFFTSVGDRVIAGRENPLRIVTLDDGQPKPYLLIRGGMEGLLTRSVFYQLAEFAEVRPEKEKAVYGVYSLGIFFPLE